MDLDSLRDRYDQIKAEATLLAGGLLDIPQRVVILTHLYRDSGRNHTFSLMAAHGALWASGYFEVGGSLGRLIAQRYFYNPTERAYRLDLLREFAESFRRVNRLVCIDTYTNYHFARELGQAPGADQIIPPELLDALNRVHDAARRGRTLDPEERRLVFSQSFHCEQEVTVAPGVQAAIAGFECKIMQFLCLHPIVRFAYFPWYRWLVFRNFGNKDERIRQGLQAFDQAERMGWPHVERTLRDYGVMPREHLEAPDRQFAALRDDLARQAAQASALFGSPPASA